MESRIQCLIEGIEYEVRIIDEGRCLDYCVMGDIAEAAEWAYNRMQDMGVEDVEIRLVRRGNHEK